jgi:hypothetical protein
MQGVCANQTHASSYYSLCASLVLYYSRLEFDLEFFFLHFQTVFADVFVCSMSGVSNLMVFILEGHHMQGPAFHIHINGLEVLYKQ